MSLTGTALNRSINELPQSCLAEPIIFPTLLFYVHKIDHGDASWGRFRDA